MVDGESLVHSCECGEAMGDNQHCGVSELSRQRALDKLIRSSVHLRGSKESTGIDEE